MYSLTKEKNEKLVTLKKFDANGFMMISKGKSYTIQGQKICDIKIQERRLANPLVYKKVSKKYEKLIALLSDLLVSDDETGDAYREALNQIERFRLEIKNKYRDYLNKKELELMSKQLKILKKQAKIKYEELYLSLNKQKTSGKNR